MNTLQKIFHTHPDNMTLDYNHIVDGIYAGNNQCCLGMLTKVFKDEKISADMSLEAERIDQPFGIEIYTWIPTVDHSIPTIDQLNLGVSVLEKLVSQNKKVYVHCKNGHGRTSTFISAYLMKKNNMTQEEAFDFIKAKRPGAHMSESQINFLKENREKIVSSKK